MNAHSSTRTFHQRRLRLTALALMALAALPILAQNRHTDDDDEDKKSPIPTGLFITPTALNHAVQQVFNPGLANYPNFVAGEAVKAVVSPNGKTLAILTAGMNSLYDPNGNIDTGASTQFLFLY